MEHGELRVRRMTEDDLGAVCRIERTVFGAPWSRESFRREVAEVANALPMVAEDDGSVIGYSISWIVVDELHIGNLAVDPARQGEGIGTELLLASIERAVRAGVATATLEVRASNDRAIRLYERHGFRPIAIRKRYYSDNGEDALVMMARIERTGGPG